MSLGADVPSQLQPGLAARDRRRRARRARSTLALSPGFLLLTGTRALSTADVYARADELGCRRAISTCARELHGAVLEIADSPTRWRRCSTTTFSRRRSIWSPRSRRRWTYFATAGATRERSSAARVRPRSASSTDLESAEQARDRVAPQWRGEAIVAGVADSAYAAPRAALRLLRTRSGIGQNAPSGEPRRRDVERVVEAGAEVLDRDRRRQLDDLLVVEMLAQPREQLVGDIDVRLATSPRRTPSPASPRLRRRRSLR